jgi:hypothetical protein
MNMLLCFVQRKILLYCKNQRLVTLFSDLFVEKRHADHLAKPNLDDESRLEVIYRILKD